jgi:cell division protein FtsL
MARQPEVQYINAYVSGSIAYQLNTMPARKKKKVTLPKPRREKKTVVRLDPVAICGIAMAAVLLVLLVVGFARLQDARAEAAALESYVSDLREENKQLQDTYSAGYDLEEIEKIAQAMGMVPQSQIPQVEIEVNVPQQESQPTAWESFCAFLTGLFA